MSWVLALLIGVVAGYGAVDGERTGMIVAALALVLLPIVYSRQERFRDIGVLFIGLGALPAVLWGRALLTSTTDSGPDVADGTLQLFLLACVLIVVGIGIVLSTARSPRP